MEKQLAVKMNKIYDFPDGEAEKYAILAYFKEQQRVQNEIINSAVNEQLAATQNITLSQQIAMGLTDKELEIYKQNLINNRQGNNINVSSESKEAFQHISTTNISMPDGAGSGFTVTDLILCVIAFLLFLILITQ